MELEDLGDFEQPFGDVEVGEVDAGKGRKRKNRVRNWTAEDRTRHQIFERERREAFNDRLRVFLLLISDRRIAALTARFAGTGQPSPNLKNAKDTQLSKHVIVDESVKYHHQQEARLLELTQSLVELTK